MSQITDAPDSIHHPGPLASLRVVETPRSGRVSSAP